MNGVFRRALIPHVNLEFSFENIFMARAINPRAPRRNVKRTKGPCDPKYPFQPFYGDCLGPMIYGNSYHKYLLLSLWFYFLQMWYQVDRELRESFFLFFFVFCSAALNFSPLNFTKNFRKSPQKSKQKNYLKAFSIFLRQELKKEQI